MHAIFLRPNVIPVVLSIQMMFRMVLAVSQLDTSTTSVLMIDVLMQPLSYDTAYKPCAESSSRLATAATYRSHCHIAHAADATVVGELATQPQAP